jgi:UDP-N-acetylmuramoylalanine-D-glutamate ligase
VVTNCTPNHRDWHGTFEAYRAAKAVLDDGGVPRLGQVLAIELDQQPAAELTLPPLSVLAFQPER